MADLVALWGIVQEVFFAAVDFALNTWWLWFFIIVFPIFRLTWLFWRQSVYKDTHIDWKLFEILIPREVLKGPRGMEQVLQTMNEISNWPGDFSDFYIDGEVPRWLSLEFVSFGGEIHMYVRTYRQAVRMVQGAFFSFYPDVEVVEVEDYVKRFPQTFAECEAKGYDLWGTEILLQRPAMFPIRTYRDFEAPAEEIQFDPMSAMLELFTKAHREETLAIQLLITPMLTDWGKEFNKEVEELKSKGLVDFGAFSFPVKTQRQSDILQAVEENLSKPAFETVIRFIYLSPKKILSDTFARRGLIKVFNQYASLDMNFMQQNFNISTRTKIWNWPHIFPKLRLRIRKQRMLYYYLHRETAPESWVERVFHSHPLAWNHTKGQPMNVEVLATLFHPPMNVVLTAPHIRRIESRRAGPSAGLPIYGEDSELEQFQ